MSPSLLCKSRRRTAQKNGGFCAALPDRGDSRGNGTRFASALSPFFSFIRPFPTILFKCPDDSTRWTASGGKSFQTERHFRWKKGIPNLHIPTRKTTGIEKIGIGGLIGPSPIRDLAVDLTVGPIRTGDDTNERRGKCRSTRSRWLMRAIGIGAQLGTDTSIVIIITTTVITAAIRTGIESSLLRRTPQPIRRSGGATSCISKR